MADEADGVDEVFEAALRIGLTVAGRMAEQAARARELAARDAQASSEQDAREMQARLDAERSAARAQLAAPTPWTTSVTPGKTASAPARIAGEPPLTATRRRGPPTRPKLRRRACAAGSRAAPSSAKPKGCSWNDSGSAPTRRSSTWYASRSPATSSWREVAQMLVDEAAGR